MTFVETFILLAPLFTGSKFGIQKFTERPGSLFCTSMGDCVVFPAMGKAHQLHFSGFKNHDPQKKDVAKRTFNQKRKILFHANRISSKELQTRSCAARAVVISFTVWWKSRSFSQGVWMMMKRWAMKKDKCKITGSNWLISIVLMVDVQDCVHYLCVIALSTVSHKQVWGFVRQHYGKKRVSILCGPCWESELFPVIIGWTRGSVGPSL